MRSGRRHPGVAQALLLLMLGAFALLGFCPATLPVALGGMPLAMALQIEICHAGPEAPQDNPGETCLFCQILGGGDTAGATPSPAVGPAVFARIKPPGDATLPRPRPIRVFQPRGPPVRGFSTA